MATNHQEVSDLEAASRAMKACRLADDSIMALKLAQYLESPHKVAIHADNQ